MFDFFGRAKIAELNDQNRRLTRYNADQTDHIRTLRHRIRMLESANESLRHTLSRAKRPPDQKVEPLSEARRTLDSELPAQTGPDFWNAYSGTPAIRMASSPPPESEPVFRSGGGGSYGGGGASNSYDSSSSSCSSSSDSGSSSSGSCD